MSCAGGHIDHALDDSMSTALLYELWGMVRLSKEYSSLAAAHHELNVWTICPPFTVS